MGPQVIETQPKDLAENPVDDEDIEHRPMMKNVILAQQKSARKEIPYDSNV